MIGKVHCRTSVVGTLSMSSRSVLRYDHTVIMYEAVMSYGDAGDNVHDSMVVMCAIMVVNGRIAMCHGLRRKSCH